jgi:hypothetical protein
MIPKDQKKYNNSRAKYEAKFTVVTPHVIHAVVKYKRFMTRFKPTAVMGKWFNTVIKKRITGNSATAKKAYIPLVVTPKGNNITRFIRCLNCILRLLLK